MALGVDVGLDVETADRAVRSDPLQLARRRFSPAEAASLEGARQRHARHLWRVPTLGAWSLLASRSRNAAPASRLD